MALARGGGNMGGAEALNGGGVVGSRGRSVGSLDTEAFVGHIDVGAVVGCFRAAGQDGSVGNLVSAKVVSLAEGKLDEVLNDLTVCESFNAGSEGLVRRGKRPGWGDGSKSSVSANSHAAHVQRQSHSTFDLIISIVRYIIQHFCQFIKDNP